ncbi:hypothetical protein RND64_08795 [Gordonia sp. w5E2]|nr:hypothetical protein [Gordonia jacobaea]
MSDDHCVAKEPSQAPVQTDSIRDYLLENTSGLGESEETSSGSNSSFEDDALSKRDEVAFESTVVAPKLSCLKDSGSDKEGKGLSNKPAELSRVSFDAWALLGAADDVFIAAATDLGVNAGVLCGKAQTEFGDGEYRTVVDWSRVVAQFLTTSIGSDDAVQAELPTTVPDMTDVLRSADDDTLLTLDEFYKGWRIGVIAEFLDARDLVAGDATEYWDYQRAMRAELLYSGEVLSERAWFTLFASRVWASDGDRGESDRAEGLSRLRAVQLDMGLIPKHGRRLRELQTATAVALGDVPEESDDSSGQRAGYSM